jgi:hypothetical protein
MDDYHDFRREHEKEIEIWRKRWSPKYVSMSGVTPISEEEPAKASEKSTKVPAFNPVAEFFKVLKKKDQGLKAEQLRSLQTFERRPGESLRATYVRMKRLIVSTKGVTQAQSVQHWYGVLDKDLRWRVRDVMLTNEEAPTLEDVFHISERIDLNWMEEKVVATGFSHDQSQGTSTSSKPQQSTNQPRGQSVSAKPQGGGGRQGAVSTSYSPSYAGQVECWECGGPHRKIDCPELKKMKGNSSGGSTAPQARKVVVCDNCGKEGHPIERCFQLHPELMRSGPAWRKGSGKGQGGGNSTSGRGGGTQSKDATAAVRIEELEKMVASLAMRVTRGKGEATPPAGSSARTDEPSTSRNVESSRVASRFADLDFMCGAAQLESGAAVTRATTRISDPRGAGAELERVSLA